MNLRVFIDGGSRGNPGPAGAGVVIQDLETSAPLHEAGYFLGRKTNNVAEYSGLLKALQVANTLAAKRIEIYSDSELMVRQITGQYKVKSPDLRPLFEEAQQLLGRFDHWTMRHVRREFNQRADELANEAMNAGRDVIVESMDGFTPASSPPCDPVATRSAAAARADRPARSTPCWTVTFPRGAGPGCPSPCPAREDFVFGPDTPAGFCVYAAEAVFASDPLHPQSPQQTISTCRHCGATIEIQRMDY